MKSEKLVVKVSVMEKDSLHRNRRCCSKTEEGRFETHRKCQLRKTRKDGEKDDSSLLLKRETKDSTGCVLLFVRENIHTRERESFIFLFTVDSHGVLFAPKYYIETSFSQVTQKH
jgi:hypothetical protein